MKFWIKVFYVLRLRAIVNVLQRILKGEPWKPRAELPTFQTPGEVEKYIDERFVWRADGMRLGGLFIPLDYVSRPEVTQHRLEAEGGVDGDCDDHHFWVAHVLQDVPGVEWATPMSCVWKGGGHTTCLFKYRGVVHLFNYTISGPTSEKEAPNLVLKWKNAKREKEGLEPLPRLRFWVRETIKHKLVDCG